MSVAVCVKPSVFTKSNLRADGDVRYRRRVAAALAVRRASRAFERQVDVDGDAAAAA